MRRFALAALLLVMPTAAQAYEAGDLLRDCKLQMRAVDRTIVKDEPTLNDAMAIGGCMAYIDAVGQTMTIMGKGLPAGDKGRLCLPRNYAVRDGIRAVVKFMDAKPAAQLATSAADMAMAGLVEAYPCR